MISLIMGALGVGRMAAIGIVAAVGFTFLSIGIVVVVDAIGDARETKLRKQSVEDRLRTIEDAKERERVKRNLPIWAKAYCAAEGPGTECCGSDDPARALQLPARCAAPPRHQ